MALPKIDIASLPDLPALTGVYGSHQLNVHTPHNDGLVAVMSYLYNIM